MRKFITGLTIAGLMTIGLAAQSVPIHSHPQKLAYLSEAERFPLDAQCQWREEPVPLGIIDPAWQHTHIQLWPFLYQEIDNNLIRIPFAIMLRNTKGTAIIDLERQELVVKIEWDDIGESRHRELQGNPQGIVMWHGHITIDPQVDHGGHKFTPHGWYSPQFEVITFYNSGANVLQLVRLPFYSVQDLNVSTSNDLYPSLVASCYPHTAGITEWGTNYVEAETFLPLLPISTLWSPIVTSAAYGGNEIGEV